MSKDTKFDRVINAAGQPVTFNMAIRHLKANGFLYMVSIFENDFIFDMNALISG